MPLSVSRPIWKPPPWPKLKVNFDGAVFREIQGAGVESLSVMQKERNSSLNEYGHLLCEAKEVADQMDGVEF
nr:hypothetical protein CFP56_26837 [Quercus suber]